VAAPVANLVSVPPVDAALMGVDLIILSSDSEDEVDWKALVVADEVNWEVLLKMSMMSSLWVASPCRGFDSDLDALRLALALMLG
jgi:hypothetical protein